MKETSSSICPSCRRNEVRPFFEMREMPTYVNFLWNSAGEARSCPRGDIVLGLCHGCGLMTNTAFDPELLAYREGYENSLHFSAVFQEYALDLADRLIESYGLRGKRIIEIGCGRGDFLWMLCHRGNNTGTGFDPSHPGPPEGSDARLTFVRDYYSEKYADYDCDFVCSRHTLEHVQDPTALLGPLRRSIGSRLDTAVFFEVPNGLHTIRNLFLWDIIYEHTSYFTETSIRDVFERTGFSVGNTYETFDGQYLCVESRPTAQEAQHDTRDLGQLIHETERFERACRRYLEDWQTRLDQLKTQSKKTVVWGGGSKGVTFLNLFPTSHIDYVIDVNPNKHGKHIAGSGQEIVPPEYLNQYPADAIIVVNPIYRSEIETQVANLGLTPEFLLL